MNKDLLRSIFSYRMLIVLFMGFSSGLPLLLIGSTLKAWLTEAGVDLTTIGIFSLVGLPFTLKFLWAPILDRFVPQFLGRRRGWIFIAQIGLIGSLAALASMDPTQSLAGIATVALILAFFAATQDIALDAYRREILETEEFGFGNSLFITGYRFAMILASGGALFLADHLPWPTVYLVMAACMGVGILTTFLAKEPRVEHGMPRSLKEAVVSPFIDYFSRPGALWILAFILLYKIGDSMASEMTMPFYLKLGFEKTEIGAVVKVFGIWAVIGGGLLGGALMLKLGLKRSLWVFGILQALSTLGFAWLAQMGDSIPALTAVITFENLSGGMGTAAYVAFMASLTNKRFSATQYALLSSFMGLPRTVASTPTGWMAENMGWEMFFVACTLIAIPGLLLLFKIGKWTTGEVPESMAKAS